MAVEKNPFERMPQAEIIEIDASNGASVELEKNVTFDLDPDGGVVVSFDEGIEIELSQILKNGLKI